MVLNMVEFERGFCIVVVCLYEFIIHLQFQFAMVEEFVLFRLTISKYKIFQLTMRSHYQMITLWDKIEALKQH